MISYRQARRIVVGIVGGTVLVVGLAMVVLPGPAVVVVPVGLGILALEFAWARRWLRRLREAARLAVSQGREPPEVAPAQGHTKDDSG